MKSLQTEVKFTVEVNVVSEVAKLEAERKAHEAYVMELLRQHEISAGRAAELLKLDRWQLSELMSNYNISPFSEQTKEELEHEAEATLRRLEQTPQ